MQTIIRAFGLSFLLLLLVACDAHAGKSNFPTPVIRFLPVQSFPDPRLTLDSMWVEYDITQENVRGMIIHLKFTVYELKDSLADVAIYFEYDDDRGGRLRDKNQKFYSAGGDVAVYKSIKPAYEPTDFKDLQVFMPYEELDLKSGKYDLTMVLNLIFDDGRLIQHMKRHNFQFTKP